MRVGCIIQARVDSTRFPGKIAAEICGKPMLTHVVERVGQALTIDDVIVTYPLKDHKIVLECLDRRESTPRGIGIFAYQGDENDLVDRYLRAAKAHGIDIIVRVCSDNPLVDPYYIEQAVGTYFSEATPFFTNTTALREGEWVDGLGAEIFSYNRLEWLSEMIGPGPSPYREHPHLWFHEHGYAPPPADLRLDVNTEGDLEFIESYIKEGGYDERQRAVSSAEEAQKE